MRKRRKSNGVLSGFCNVNHGQSPCPGQFTNNNKIGKVTLCICNCHGDLETRLKAVGQWVEPEPDEEDLEESQ